MRQEHHAIAILGPTASGKSDVAIGLARKLNGEVISCDSRQIYRYMDIGTGKIANDFSGITNFQSPISKTEATEKVAVKNETPLDSPSPQSRGRCPKGGWGDDEACSTFHDSCSASDFICEGVRHHFLDILHPNDEYNVAMFQRDARKALEDIVNRNRVPLLCGGTGLWAQALIEDFDIPEIPPNHELREELAKLSLEKLQERLRTFNLEQYARMDTKNPRRLIRAIEVATAMENRKRITDKQKRKVASNQNPPTLPSHFPSYAPPSESTPHSSLHTTHWSVIILSPPRDILCNNIEKRLDERLREGMIEEVELLHKRHGVSWERLENFGLEYRWVSRYLQGNISYEDMREKLLIDIRHYAKRQLTWLRRWERMGRKMVWVESKEEAVRQGLTLMNTD